MTLDLALAVDQGIDEPYLAASAAACEYVRWQSAQILAACGSGGLRRARLVAAQATLGVPAELDYALEWLLAEASLLGAVEVAAGTAGPLYSAGRLVDEALAARTEREVLEHYELVGSSRPIFDHVARCYPDYLQGRRSGQMALLKGAALQLWESYFSAENPLYDVHNRLGWLGLRRALEILDRPARVLELGVGTGGGTAALVAGLLAAEPLAVETLTLSDASPSFAVNTARRLAATTGSRIALAHRRLDFTRPLVEQGIEPGSFEVLVGVNAIHNGGDLGTTLAALRPALADDGFLVISESLCAAGERVHQDFVFNLLPLPRRATAPATSRFFSAEIWRDALDAAGWNAELYVNRRGPELALVALARPRSFAEQPLGVFR